MTARTQPDVPTGLVLESHHQHDQRAQWRMTGEKNYIYTISNAGIGLSLHIMIKVILSVMRRGLEPHNSARIVKVD